MSDHLIASSESPLIVGLGSTGLSCVRYLSGRGIPCAVIDSRENPPALAALQEQFPEVPVSLGSLEADQLARAGRLVVSPGVALEEPAVAAAMRAGVSVCGDIDLFREAADAPVVGITGSNGKSTVTALLGRIASRAGVQAAVGGNLGPPALDLLDPAIELYVLELSSFQLERAGSLDLAVATVLNMSADHMDRHGSMQRYHHAKHRIFRGCEALVFNRDDPLSRPLQADTVPSWSFGLAAPDRRGFGLAEHAGQTWIFREFDPLMPIADLRLEGRHNVANALAALALAELLELPTDACLAELREFGGLPHRSQLVAEIDGVRYINDSKATNPGATLAAIDGFAAQRPVVVILGGQGKGADFSALCRSVAAKCKAAVLIGEAAETFEQMLGAGFTATRAPDLPAAVAAARGLAVPGDVVLLSPACASFDMFDGFARRGDAFIAAVLEYGEEG